LVQYLHEEGQKGLKIKNESAGLRELKAVVPDKFRLSKSKLGENFSGAVA
jgi:hypothetical protein